MANRSERLGPRHAVEHDTRFMIDQVGVLGDATRRRVYEWVVEAGGEVGREEVATALGIGRTLAAFHLDKLVEAGLLEAGTGTRVGGPGAGRPAKLYRRSPAQVTVNLPPRSYVEVATLLAEALERTGADLTLQKVARERGLVAGGADLFHTLREWGYEPVAGDGEVCLRNCPFHALAQEFPPLICGMNLALLSGLAEGAGWPARARMRPQEGHCCVVLEEAK